MLNLFKILLLLTNFGSSPSNYLSVDESFIVSFPEFHIEKSDTIQTNGQELIIYQAFHKCSSDKQCTHHVEGTTYSLTYYEIENFKFQEDYRNYFDDLSQSIISQREADLAGELQYLSKEDFKGLPSRMLRIDQIDQASQMACKARILTFKNYFVVLQVVGLKTEIRKSLALKFLNSFQLLND